jgi:hypothetical protein
LLTEKCLPLAISLAPSPMGSKPVEQRISKSSKDWETLAI